MRSPWKVNRTMMNLADTTNKPTFIKYRKWNGKIEDIIRVGDKVRIYTPRDYEDNGVVLDYKNYIEGTVIAAKKMIIDYWLTVKKEKVVFYNLVKTNDFMFGDTIGMINSNSEVVELLTPQLSMI